MQPVDVVAVITGCLCFEMKLTILRFRSAASCACQAMNLRIFAYVCAPLLLVFNSLAGDIAKNPSVEIAGERLFLANVEGSRPDGLLNEYIRTNETLENWKVLFAVRSVNTTNGVDDVVARWKSYLAQAKSPGLAVREETGSTATNRLFSLSIRPQGDAYLETDELRFVAAPGRPAGDLLSSCTST